MALFLLLLPALAQIPVVHGVLQARVPDKIVVGEEVALELSVPDREAVVHAECTVGEDKTTFDSELLSAGETARVVLGSGGSSASCLLVARFANGLSERREESFSWTWVEPEQP